MSNVLRSSTTVILVDYDAYTRKHTRSTRHTVRFHVGRGALKAQQGFHRSHGNTTPFIPVEVEAIWINGELMRVRCWGPPVTKRKNVSAALRRAAWTPNNAPEDIMLLVRSYSPELADLSVPGGRVSA